MQEQQPVELHWLLRICQISDGETAAKVHVRIKNSLSHWTDLTEFVNPPCAKSFVVGSSPRDALLTSLSSQICRLIESLGITPKFGITRMSLIRGQFGGVRLQVNIDLHCADPFYATNFQKPLSVLSRCHTTYEIPPLTTQRVLADGIRRKPLPGPQLIRKCGRAQEKWPWYMKRATTLPGRDYIMEQLRQQRKKNSRLAQKTFVVFSHFCAVVRASQTTYIWF